MKNVALAIFALAFVGFVTASGSLVAMNHPTNADRLAHADRDLAERASTAGSTLSEKAD